MVSSVDMQTHPARSLDNAVIEDRPWDAHPQVKSQLAAFGESMEKDSAAQRGEVATLVQSAAERGKEFIDDTLQLSNVQASHCGLTMGLPDSPDTHRTRMVGSAKLQRTAQLQDGHADGVHDIVAITLMMIQSFLRAVLQHSTSISAPTTSGLEMLPPKFTRTAMQRHGDVSGCLLCNGVRV